MEKLDVIEYILHDDNSLDFFHEIDGKPHWPILDDTGNKWTGAPNDKLNVDVYLYIYDGDFPIR